MKAMNIVLIILVTILTSTTCIYIYNLITEEGGTVGGLIFLIGVNWFVDWFTYRTIKDKITW